MTPCDTDVADRGDELAPVLPVPAIDSNPTTLRDLRRALEAVDNVLLEGERIHHGRWRTQALREHCDHVIAHILDGADLLERGRRNAALVEISHGAARALMLLQLALCDDTDGADRPIVGSLKGETE